LPKEITPKALRCGDTLTCPPLYEVTPAEMRCAIAASCPALYEITPTDARCPWADCPAIYEQEDGVLVVGKIAPIPEELKSKVGPDETLVWVPKGLLKDIEWA